jgi:hypothetical protein
MATLGAAASGASAVPIAYDLRFADRTHAIADPTSSTTYPVELWVRVSGTNGSLIDEKFSFSYLTIMSSQQSGGLLLSGGLQTRC